MAQFCSNCGKQLEGNLSYCPNCGVSVSGGATPPPFTAESSNYDRGESSNGIFDNGPSGKSRGVAGLLAILLGTLGVHYFYLGKITPGIVFLCASILSCGLLAAVTGIVALIQGILMMTMTESEFEQKYCNPNVSFPLF